MANVKVPVEGVWVDSITPGAKKSFGALKQTARVESQATGTLVNEGMGQAMSQFNEKTEKGRQLMTTFGGALGGAAGNATYYAGTLSYVVGRFKLWELAAMGALGGLTALGAALVGLSDPSRKLMEATRKLREETEKLIVANSKYIEQEEYRLAELSSRQIKYIEIRRQFTAVESQRLRLETLLEEKRRAIIGLGGDEAAVLKNTKDIQAELNRLKAQENDLMYQSTRVREIDTASRIKEARTKAGSVGGAPGEEFGFILGATETALRSESDSIIDFITTHNEREIALREKYNAYNERLVEENWQRRIRINENFYAHEAKMADRAWKQQAEALEDWGKIAQTSAEIFTTFLGQTSEAQIASILVEAGIQAAMEIAKGTAAMATGNFLSAGLHYLSAAQFGVVGVARAAGVGAGGGGGGASAGAMASSATRSSMQQDREAQQKTKEKSEIKIYIGNREFGRFVSEGLSEYLQQQSPGRTRSEI